MTTPPTSEIRERHMADDVTIDKKPILRLEQHIATLHSDRATLLALLTQKEAEIERRRHDYEVEQRKRMFLQWRLIEITADDEDKITKAKAALKALGNPALEREISQAQSRIAADGRELAKFIKPAMDYYNADGDWPDDTQLYITVADDDGKGDFTLGDLRTALKVKP